MNTAKHNCEIRRIQDETYPVKKESISQLSNQQITSNLQLSRKIFKTEAFIFKEATGTLKLLLLLTGQKSVIKTNELFNRLNLWKVFLSIRSPNYHSKKLMINYDEDFVGVPQG